MSDNQVDRIERKVNRIGRFVIFRCALMAPIVAVGIKCFSSPILSGYGTTIELIGGGVFL